MISSDFFRVFFLRFLLVFFLVPQENSSGFRLGYFFLLFTESLLPFGSLRWSYDEVSPRIFKSTNPKNQMIVFTEKISDCALEIRGMASSYLSFEKHIFSRIFGEVPLKIPLGVLSENPPEVPSGIFQEFFWGFNSKLHKKFLRGILLRFFKDSIRSFFRDILSKSHEILPCNLMAFLSKLLLCSFWNSLKIIPLVYLLDIDEQLLFLCLRDNP